VLNEKKYRRHTLHAQPRVHTIYGRKNTDVEQLMLISKALGYDFISEAYLNRPSLKKYPVLLETSTPLK
jgi:hypothetical protein